MSTTNNARTRIRGPWWALLIFVAGALVLGSAAALGMVLAVPPGPVPAGGTTGDPASAEAASGAPDNEVQRVHEALHRIGSLCGAKGRNTPPAGMDANVAVILSFATRYPAGRFPIDDETGTALSLLMVTREAVRDCAPAAAANVNQALPAEFRDKPTPSP